jgi:hypothetical protein
MKGALLASIDDETPSRNGCSGVALHSAERRFGELLDIRAVEMKVTEACMARNGYILSRGN